MEEDHLPGPLLLVQVGQAREVDEVAEIMARIFGDLQPKVVLYIPNALVTKNLNGNQRCERENPTGLRSTHRL